MLTLPNPPALPFSSDNKLDVGNTTITEIVVTTFKWSGYDGDEATASGTITLGQSRHHKWAWESNLRHQHNGSRNWVIPLAFTHQRSSNRAIKRAINELVMKQFFRRTRPPRPHRAHWWGVQPATS